jgi:hypothetical protein
MIPPDSQVFRTQPDRWSVAMPEWKRYGKDGEFPYVRSHWLDPFNRNKLKVDVPVFGQRTFFNFTGTSDTFFDGRRLPSPSDVSTARPGSAEFFGQGEQAFLTQSFRLSFDLFRGDTSFRPVDWQIRVTPEFNVNYLATRELGLVNIDVRQGKTRTDLFSQGEDSIFILDIALLDRLVTEKLGKVAKSVAGKEGWKWTETHADFGYNEKAQFQSVRPDPAPLHAKLAKEVEKLKGEAEKLEAQWEKAGEDAPYPDRIKEIRERLDEINESRDEEWSPEKLGMAGTVITIGTKGKAEILRPLRGPRSPTA